MSNQINAIILLAILILFLIYRRISRNIGWQLLIPRRLVIRTAIIAFIGLNFLVIGAAKPISLVSDIVGILIGVILAYYSAILTRYEQRGGRLYYKPNTWIGFIVIAIFLGRLIYRFYRMYEIGKSLNIQQGQSSNYQAMKYMAGNSWSAGLILIMFAYYVIYYIILLKNQKRYLKTDNIGL